MDSIKRSLVYLLFSLLFSSVSFYFPISLLAANQGDEYEPDDSYAAAKLLPPIPDEVVIPVEHLNHTFHNFFDEDWIRFTADPGRTYYIDAVPRDSNILCDPIIELYATDGTTLLKRVNINGAGEKESLTWRSPESANFFIRIINESIHYSSSVIYDVFVDASTIFPPPGFLTGRVKTSQGVGINGAIIESGQGIGVSLSDGSYIISLPIGDAAPGTISVRKDGYVPYTNLDTITIIEGVPQERDIVLTPNSNNQSPEITGAPEKEITVNNLYSFRPIATDGDNDSLSFSITNKPSWLSFNSENGMILGVPNKNHIGKYESITITVQDSRGASSQLPTFMIEVLEVQNVVPLSSVIMLLLK